MGSATRFRGASDGRVAWRVRNLERFLPTACHARPAGVSIASSLAISLSAFLPSSFNLALAHGSVMDRASL